MNWKITLCEPDIGNEEIEAVVKVLKSKWLTMGEVTGQFESTFAQKIGAKHAIAVTNCTAALHLANVALGIGPGDEVICPALTFVATANGTRYTGADVVFADVVSENDLTISPVDIEEKITPKTKAISIVHYAGFPCNMDTIIEIARNHNLKTIEDCAHAPFGLYLFKDGSKQFLGTIGDVGCFSFFGNKNMTTGEGGMITTNNDDLANKIKLLRSHGMTTLTLDRHKGHASGYDVVEHGYNYRIDEIRSAMGICQLNKIDTLNNKRRQVFAWYKEVLRANNNVVIPFKDRDVECATCHIMPVILRNNYQEIKNRLFEARIQTSKHYDLIPNFSIFKKYHFKSNVKLIDHIITLPMYPGLTSDDVKLIGKIICG